MLVSCDDCHRAVPSPAAHTCGSALTPAVRCPDCTARTCTAPNGAAPAAPRHGQNQPMSTLSAAAPLLHPPAGVSLPPYPPQPPLPPLGTVPPGLRAPRPAPAHPARLVAVTGDRVHPLPARHDWTTQREPLLVRGPVLARLVLAAVRLPDGFDLAVLRAWAPGDLPGGDLDSPYLTGGAVAVTLCVRGRALALGGALDPSDALAATDAAEHGPFGELRDLRRMLVHALRGSGFVNDPRAWWAFEYGTARWAALTGLPAQYGLAEHRRLRRADHGTAA